VFQSANTKILQMLRGATHLSYLKKYQLFNVYQPRCVNIIRNSKTI